MTFTTEIDLQNIQVTTLGVRGSLPLTAGLVPIAIKGDLAWNHFFSDTEAFCALQPGGFWYRGSEGRQARQPV